MLRLLYRLVSIYRSKRDSYSQPPYTRIGYSTLVDAKICKYPKAIDVLYRLSVNG